MVEHNQLGQPVGFAIPDWRCPPRPPRRTLTGRWCCLEPLLVTAHAPELHQANQLDPDGRLWTYLGYGPFVDFPDYTAWLEAHCSGDDPLFFAIRDGDSGRVGGVASYLRVDPERGAIEIGHLCFAPPLQRTRAATEALHLLLHTAFELGYRRCEWKCDSLNAASRRAAERLGFCFEGVFRNALVYKGRNRDTAWYAIIDRDWPMLRVAFETWLDPANFNPEGRQRRSLGELRGGSPSA